MPNAKSLAKWLAVATLTPLPIKKIVAPLSRAVNSISTNDLISTLKGLSDKKLLNVEMESSAIFVVAQLRQLHAAMVCGVSGNLVASDYDYGQGEKNNDRLVQAWENAIQIALKAICIYDRNGYASGSTVDAEGN